LFDGAPGTNPATYASWVRPGPDTTGFLYVGFDFEDIPKSAVIRSVKIRYRIYIEDPNQMRFTSVSARVVIYPNIEFAPATVITEALPYTPEMREINVPLDQGTIPLDVNALRDANFAVHLALLRSNQGGNATAYIDYVDAEIAFGATKVWSATEGDWVGGKPMGWSQSDSAYYPLRIRSGGLWI
jgi:hypothetical protein